MEEFMWLEQSGKYIKIERLSEQMALKTSVSEWAAGQTDPTQEKLGWMDKDNADDKSCGRTDEPNTSKASAAKVPTLRLPASARKKTL